MRINLHIDNNDIFLNDINISTICLKEDFLSSCLYTMIKKYANPCYKIFAREDIFFFETQWYGEEFIVGFLPGNKRCYSCITLYLKNGIYAKKYWFDYYIPPEVLKKENTALSNFLQQHISKEFNNYKYKLETNWGVILIGRPSYFIWIDYAPKS